MRWGPGSASPSPFGGGTDSSGNPTASAATPVSFSYVRASSAISRTFAISACCSRNARSFGDSGSSSLCSPFRGGFTFATTRADSASPSNPSSADSGDASSSFASCVRSTRCRLAVAAAKLLGAPDAPGLRGIGAGYGAAGVLRNTAALARSGTCLLPADLLAQHGLSVDAVTSQPDAPALQPVFAALAVEGRSLLGGSARRGLALAAALPAVLARRDLRRPGEATPRALPDRLAVTAAAATGRA